MGCAETKALQTSTLQLTSSSATNPKTADKSHPDARFIIRTASMPPKHEFLTPTEKTIVIDGWERVARHDANRQQQMGERIFLRLFELAPTARSSFKVFADMDDPVQLRANHVFKSHAARFVRVIAGVVDNIDDLDVIVKPNLILLGRGHQMMGNKQIVREYFDMCQQALTETMVAELDRQTRQDTGEKTSKNDVGNGLGGRPHENGNDSSEGHRQTEVAWRKLFGWITDRVFEGYCEKQAVPDKIGQEDQAQR